MIPSQFRPITAFEKCLALNLLTVGFHPRNAPAATAWPEFTGFTEISAEKIIAPEKKAWACNPAVFGLVFISEIF
jgi:hypothetical protein